MSEGLVRIYLESSESINYDAQAESDFINSLPWKLPRKAKLYISRPASLKYVDTPEAIGGGAELAELLVTFAEDNGTLAAVIAALYSVIKIYVQRNINREVTIERDDKKISIKGHSMSEVREMLDKLFPELEGSFIAPSPSRLETSFSTAKLKIYDGKDQDNDFACK